MEDSGNRLVELCDGKAGQHYRSGRCERVWERAGRRPDDPVPGGRDKSGMLPGILFDRMEIMDGENRSVRIDRPVVAVSKEPLFFRKDFYDDPAGKSFH